MARPTRQGIDYFPYDVDLDQDDKLGMIVGEFKIKGENLYIKLCAWIYKENGYYTEWNENVQLKFLRRYDYCGFSVSFLNEVVPRLIKWELFDRTVFDSSQILTSARIQKTWLEATRKRIDCVIDERIRVLDVSSAEKAAETPKTPEETPQSKVKEIKENERKAGDARAEVEIFFRNNFRKYRPNEAAKFDREHSEGTTADQLSIKRDKIIAEVVEQFWNHYESSDWKKSGGVLITNKIAAFKNWMTKEKQFAK